MTKDTRDARTDPGTLHPRDTRPSRTAPGVLAPAPEVKAVYANGWKYDPHKYWNARTGDPNANEPHLLLAHEEYVQQCLDSNSSSVPPDMCGVLLDHGVGKGRLFPVYNDADVEQVVGYDICEARLEEAAELSKQFDFEYEGSSREIPYHWFYDVCVCMNVLQHMPETAVLQTLEKWADVDIPELIIGVSTFVATYGELNDHCYRNDYIRLFHDSPYRIRLSSMEWPDDGNILFTATLR